MDDSSIEPPRVAFIGGGNMAGALIGGLVNAGHPPRRLLVVEPDAARRDALRERFGVEPLAAAGDAIGSAQVVVWAVKPQSFAEAAAPCRGRVGSALQVSVMAGVRSATIAAATAAARIVRTMPNTPALIGRGITALHADAAVGDVERRLVERLLAPTGRLLWVDREALLDAVTALSGSGPAYVFYVIEAMVQAGVELGLPAAQARTLAEATIDGAAALASASPLQPAELRAQVTSKGGTTQAAIEVLDAAGVQRAFVAALHAAARRAGELGDQLGR